MEIASAAIDKELAFGFEGALQPQAGASTTSVSGTEYFDADTPDIELCRLATAGNIAAFELLYQKYHRRTYSLCLRMTSSQTEAEDLTQEVFIKVHSALKDFREEANLFTWLYRIATNYSINHLKKVKVRNTVSVEMVVEPIESTDKRADEEIDEETRRQYLMEAIETLPAQQRAVFNMRYYDQLQYDEIAEMLGKSTGGIKANYFHAVKKIGEYLKGKIE